MFFVDLQVEHVDTSELFEEYALAFHDGLGCQWPNIAQTEHCCSVGDHCHKVAPGGVLVGIVGVFDNFLAGGGHAGRIGQRQIVLVEKLLGGADGDFSGSWKLVVLQRGLAQLRTFFRRTGNRWLGGNRRLVWHLASSAAPADAKKAHGPEPCY